MWQLATKFPKSCHLSLLRKKWNHSRVLVPSFPSVLPHVTLRYNEDNMANQSWTTRTATKWLPIQQASWLCQNNTSPRCEWFCSDLCRMNWFTVFVQGLEMMHHCGFTHRESFLCVGELQAGHKEDCVWKTVSCSRFSRKNAVKLCGPSSYLLQSQLN